MDFSIALSKKSVSNLSTKSVFQILPDNISGFLKIWKTTLYHISITKLFSNCKDYLPVTVLRYLQIYK